MSQSARTKIVNQFTFSGVDGPRVLIMSNVSQTGLNLPCTNFLVIIVRIYTFFVSFSCHLIGFCFSPTAGQAVGRLSQLEGRIQRYPQLEPVHVYHLIAAEI
jgi:hypothetical protein